MATSLRPVRRRWASIYPSIHPSNPPGHYLRFQFQDDDDDCFALVIDFVIVVSLLRIKCGYTAESVDVREGSMCVHVRMCVCMVCGWTD